MNKKKFLKILEEQLTGQLHDSAVASHLKYYSSYIEEEQKKGRSEEEILSGLGDPHLIARTLLDTSPGSDSRSPSAEASRQREDTFSENFSGHSRRRSFRLDLTTWYGKLIVMAIAAAVLVLLFVIVGLLIPVILIAGLVIYLISCFRRK